MRVPPRIPVTSAQIDRVTARFYAQVRSHPTLGPIFAAHVTDWPSHEAKIASFWRNALLLERSYDGNPMQAHMRAGNVDRAHFAPWLALFDSILHEELPTDLAQSWSALAHRIGRGLQTGLPAPCAHATGVPHLG